MREKLIELLNTHCDYAGHVDCKEDCTECLADHLIANGVTVQQWIPVTERLPENMDDRVLVLLPTKSYDYPIGNQHIDTDRYRGGYRKWVRYGDKVTHWKPLPQPPKEG